MAIDSTANTTTRTTGAANMPSTATMVAAAQESRDGPMLADSLDQALLTHDADI